MPELPDVLVYVDALRSRVRGEVLERVRIKSPFLLRTFEPDVDEAVGRVVRDVRRIGKRIVFEMGPTVPHPEGMGHPISDDADRLDATAGDSGPLFFVIHLMIAGRFRWLKRGAAGPGKIGLATFDFPSGTLALTEAGKKKRASLHVVRGADALAAFDPGGLDVLAESDAESAGSGTKLAQFAAALKRENHTLKRALTDPRLFDGIGNAYSDEILHAAGLSPLTWTSRLGEDEIGRLFAATRATLTGWIERLRAEFADRFPGPGEITAFRPGFAVHGRFGEPCPTCGCAVQRIRYAENETNYCPTCQNNGRVLADRSLSRLLKDDWPRTVNGE